MSFLSKQDYFNIDDGTTIVVVMSNSGASHSVAEAKGSDGSIVAHEVYGYTEAPSCEYKLKQQLSYSAANAKKLGGISTVPDPDGNKYCLKSFSISTSAGGEPTISADGEMVNADAVEGCVYKIPAFTLSKNHHAQILMDAFTLTGAGCNLTKADYSFSCSINKALKEGTCLAFDVSEGKIEAGLEFNQTGADEPVVTPGEGWFISSPLTLSNPDSDYGSWSCTLTKYLAKA